MGCVAGPPVEPDLAHCSNVDLASCPGATSEELSGPVSGSQKRTRGSNTQATLPNNLHLADVDGDGNADYLQVAGPRLFVSHVNYEQTGILHQYFPHDIKRVFTGDFKGIGRDYVCLSFADGYLRCYKGSDVGQSELWWTWTQGNFIASVEDVIVADYDGDGGDDLLLYHKVTGAIRFASVNGQGVLGVTDKVALGQLAAMQKPGLQLRAGDFHGDGLADILVWNGQGQLHRYSAVKGASKTTFVWSFTTNAGQVSASDELHIARLDDNLADDIVIRSKQSGVIKMYDAKYQSGWLKPLTGVSKGQLPAATGGKLVWTWTKTITGEPGSTTRDDALFLGNGVATSTKARWAGGSYTYFWSNTQVLPNNHAGWPEPKEHQWLILKCKLADVPEEPEDDAYYQKLFVSKTAPDNIVAYYRDVSYGALDLSVSVLDQTWYTAKYTTEEFHAVERPERKKSCMEAAGSPDVSGYYGVVHVWNSENADVFGSKGSVVLEYNKSLMTMAHEFGHGEGFGHSWNDTADGEYKDPWDVMSAASAYCFPHPEFGCAGPGMNAPNVTKYGWVPAHRILSLVSTATEQTETIDLAPLNRPEMRGPMIIKIGSNALDYYTVEYRQLYGWDQDISNPDADAVLVHRVTNGKSILQTNGQGTANALRAPGGDPFLVTGPTDGNGVLSVVVTVDTFDADESTARVVVTHKRI
jgi:hypothetical protein